MSNNTNDVSTPIPTMSSTARTTHREYSKHMRSDVDSAVFGRDIDGSDRTDAVRPSRERPSERTYKESRAQPKHMRSDVDSAVFGRDMDGSDSVNRASLAEQFSPRRVGVVGGSVFAAESGRRWRRSFRR